MPYCSPRLSPRRRRYSSTWRTGDTAVRETRGCGCGWEDLGLVHHLHSIRSFEKLTGEGMTILGTDLVCIVEEVLPQRFGGSITDYQLVEREDEAGFTRIDILISPDVPGVDEADARRIVFDALKKDGARSGSAGLSVEVWKQADTLRIRRDYPKRTKVGKIFSFQTERLQPK